MRAVSNSQCCTVCMNPISNYSKIYSFPFRNFIWCEQTDETWITMMELKTKITRNYLLVDKLENNILTGNIALKRWVISVAPRLTAASPWSRFDIEWPNDTVMRRFTSSSITSSAFVFSGASVIIEILPTAPYASSTVWNLFSNSWMQFSGWAPFLFLAMNGPSTWTPSIVAPASALPARFLICGRTLW